MHPILLAAASAPARALHDTEILRRRGFFWFTSLRLACTPMTPPLPIPYTSTAVPFAVPRRRRHSLRQLTALPLHRTPAHQSSRTSRRRLSVTPSLSWTRPRPPQHRRPRFTVLSGAGVRRVPGFSCVYYRPVQGRLRKSPYLVLVALQ